MPKHLCTIRLVINGSDAEEAKSLANAIVNTLVEAQDEVLEVSEHVLTEVISVHCEQMAEG